MFISGRESSVESKVCNESLLPRPQTPVMSSNWNAEHPTVAMHIVVQCICELEIKEAYINKR